MIRKIAAAVAVAVGTIGLSIPGAWATSPNTPHPFLWGEANYQIVGNGTYVDYFHGVVVNAQAEPLTVEMWIEHNNQRITPVSTVRIGNCGIWNWKINEYRNMGKGAYWINYLISAGGPRQYIHWAYSVE